MPEGRKILFGIIAVLLGWGLLALYTAHQGGVVDEARQEAAKYQLQAAEAAKDRDRLKAEAVALAHDRTELEERLKRALQTRPTAPKPPGPAPTDHDLAGSLVGKGLSPGLTISPVSFSTLTPMDARTAWSWSAEAERIPGFELKSAADDQIIATQSQVVGGLKAELSNCEVRNTLADKQIGSLKKETAEWVKVADGQVKLLAAEKLKTKIVIGVSVPVAAWLGWKVGRR